MPGPAKADASMDNLSGVRGNAEADPPIWKSRKTGPVTLAERKAAGL